MQAFFYSSPSEIYQNQELDWGSLLLAKQDNVAFLFYSMFIFFLTIQSLKRTFLGQALVKVPVMQVPTNTFLGLLLQI